MVGFIQTGDIHIGESRQIPNYLERHKKVLWEITERAHKAMLPLVIAGDLFHARTTTHEERILASSWLSDLDEKAIPTILIPGNHDHVRSDVTQIDLFRYYRFQHVRVVTWKPEVVILGDIGFICMGWQDYGTEEIERLVRYFLPQIIHLKYKVVVLHECILGSLLDNGLRLPKGTKLPIVPEITYWAVGDLHCYQTTNVDNGFYAGAPAQYTFGDIRKKGVLRVDLDNPTNPEFVPIYSKPLLKVRSVSEITEDAHYLVEGEFDAVLEANNHAQVVKTKCSDSVQDVMEYERLGLVDGLLEFLADKGIDQDYQKMGLDWVKSEFSLGA